MQKDDLYLSVARIHGNGRGVAFLIDKYSEPLNGVYGLWLTCTHVCGENGAISAYVSEDDIHPRFEISIKLEREQCFPEEDSDLSLLFSPEPIPKHITPLMTRNEWDSVNHSISLYGFPNDSSVDGVPEDGAILQSVRARDNRRNPQILFKSIAVSSGFSGSPVYDNKLGAIIGMVTEVTNPDNIGRRGSAVFAIPLSFIGKMFPQLNLYPNLPVSRERVSYSVLEKVNKVEMLERLSRFSSMDDMTIEEKLERAVYIQKLREILIGNLEKEQSKHISEILFYNIISGQKITTNDKKELGFLIKNKDIPWYLKSMVANALAISLIGNFDPIRLDYLLDFVIEEEDKVWQHALTGVVLGLFEREALLKKSFPVLLNKLKGLKTRNLIQTGIKYLMGHLNKMKFKEYEKKVKIFNEIKVKIEQELPKEIQPIAINDISGRLGEEDSDFGLFLLLNNFKKDKVFKDPHFWLLPFHKENDAIKELLNLKSDLIPAEIMLDLLDHDIVLSNSQKYSLCYHYNELPNSKLKKLLEIFTFEKQELEKYAKNDKNEAESISNSIYGNILSDFFQFQLFFPQERLKMLMDYQFDLQVMPINNLIAQSPVLLEIETERLTILARALKNQGKPNLAIKKIEEIIELDPQRASSYEFLADSFAEQDKYDLAIENYKFALRLNPLADSTFTKWGVVLRKQGKLDLAIKKHEEAIRLNPKADSAYCNLGVALHQQGKIELAIEKYEIAIRLDPQDSQYFINLGIALSAQGKPDIAIKQLEEAIRLNPKNHTTYMHLGDVFYTHNKYEFAIEKYEFALQLSPNNSMIYNRIGNVLSDIGEINLAIENYKKSISFNPQSSSAYSNLANAFLTIGILKKAEINYLKALELEPNGEYNLMNFGHLLLAKGDKSNAIINYTKSRNLFIDREVFYNGMSADYTDFNLSQYKITKDEYDVLINLLRIKE